MASPTLKSEILSFSWAKLSLFIACYMLIPNLEWLTKDGPVIFRFLGGFHTLLIIRSSSYAIEPPILLLTILFQLVIAYLVCSIISHTWKCALKPRRIGIVAFLMFIEVAVYILLVNTIYYSADSYQTFLFPNEAIVIGILYLLIGAVNLYSVFLARKQKQVYGLQKGTFVLMFLLIIFIFFISTFSWNMYGVFN